MWIQGSLGGMPRLQSPIRITKRQQTCCPEPEGGRENTVLIKTARVGRFAPPSPVPAPPGFTSVTSHPEMVCAILLRASSSHGGRGSDLMPAHFS